MKRTVIIVKKDLTAGQIGNVCAVLMAQVARVLPEAMSDKVVIDADGLTHAAPKYSVVVLRGNGPIQLKNAAENIRVDEPQLKVFGFSKTGQELNNQFDVYQQRISSMSTEATELVGIAVAGDDDTVRRVTKKFSIL